ncbi:hypothetical protein ACH4JZ_18465 [Streptomyces sp. NPDC017615]|uniref:hypothetical protein n=1 Tax=Streptomyces sp. NPDC017615 TaxID=3365003 RepID=UPI0037987467
MSTPPAAVAVLRAAIEDAHVAELLNRPGMTAWRAARALERAGWTITATRAETASRTGAHRR